MPKVGRSIIEAAQGAMMGVSIESTEPGGTIQDVISWQTQGASDPDNATEIWVYNTATRSYKMAWLFDSGCSVASMDGHWIDPDTGSETTLELKKGSSWWFYSKPDASRVPGWTWTEPVPY